MSQSGLTPYTLSTQDTNNVAAKAALVSDQVSGQSGITPSTTAQQTAIDSAAATALASNQQ